ncbi:hypothetical protein PINS_up008510 [Pythium insidiosum]|nr:hypothetical protein PINS_up008510 [Pythium insidiosum]
MTKDGATARPKPSSRPKSAKVDAHAAAEDAANGGTDGAKPHTATATASAATKKRRPSQKKKDARSTSDAGGKRDSRAAAAASAQSLRALQHEDRRYERAPRLLPEIHGVRALSNAEIQGDIKHLTSALAAFESKMRALLPPSHHTAPGTYVAGTQKESEASADDAWLQKRRAARPNGVLTPEELVESLPVCRRAVRITQRELAAMKRERDDLERDFMRLRCKLMWQIAEMKRIQRQQERVLRVLSSDVVDTAKTLASSRRRTNALQNIMTELEARGSAIVRLTREKHQLETLLQRHNLELPEAEELFVGDRVSTPFGHGRVTAMDTKNRLLTVDMEKGGVAYVQDEDVEVLPAEISYLEQERDLKQTFFEKIGALVQPNGKLSLLSGSGAARKRGRGAADSDLDAADDDMDDADAHDDDEDDEEHGDDALNDGAEASSQDAADEDVRKKTKKRKLVAPPPSSRKKQRQQQKVFDFTACKIPITPYDSGLLLSPLSTMPDRVAAVSPGALQWMSSYLPSQMVEWEKDRYNALQMQGEIERLRFQLKRAEAEKLDAQQHASDQLESINQLVTQLDKLREQLAMKESKDGTGSASSCSCGSSMSSPGRKTSSSSSKGGRSNGRSRRESASQRRQRAESMDDGSDSGKEKQRQSADDDEQADDRPQTPQHQENDDDADENGELSDSSRPLTRSLRPRRSAASGAATTTASSS